MNIDCLRPNEFKLRQREYVGSKLTLAQRKEANAFVKKGFSKKTVITFFGCTYKDLKLN